MTTWRFFVGALGVLLAAARVRSQNLTDDQLSAVIDRLAEGAKQSWELGTRAEALTEFSNESYSVLNNTHIPPPTSSTPSSLSDVIAIAHDVVANRTVSNRNETGPQPLIGDSAAGDPASVGVAVLLANWTGVGQQDGLDYAGAASDQLQFLLQDVPRTDDGAISHRTEQVQLWSDFVYMAPPFIAYYGVLTGNQSLITEAYNQCRLYRQYLKDNSTSGLWKHIVLGKSGTDSGHWSTGNGWAAAGMLRVLGTIQNSQYSKSFKNEQNDLANWVREIHNGMYPNLQSDGLFLNYADDNSTFSDASSTAILASTVYRLALLTDTHTYLPLAEQSRQALSAPNTNSSSNATLAHFDENMWLTPVVDPYQFGIQGSKSPEGQAFVVEMYAAWRDWREAGSPGSNAAVRMGAGYFSVVLAVVLCVGVGWVW